MRTWTRFSELRLRAPGGRGGASRGLILLGLGVALLLPGRARGQAPPPPPPPQVETTVVDSLTLRVEREVFVYPEFARRSPFRPLLSQDDGPRFEDLRLLGVILASEPGASVALVGIGGAAAGGPAAAAAAAPTRRLRPGDSWGNVRVVEIQRTRVLVDVTEFGLTDRREIVLRRPTEGGF